MVVALFLRLLNVILIIAWMMAKRAMQSGSQLVSQSVVVRPDLLITDADASPISRRTNNASLLTRGATTTGDDGRVAKKRGALFTGILIGDALRC